MSAQTTGDVIAGWIIIVVKAPIYFLTIWALAKYVGCGWAQ